MFALAHSSSGSTTKRKSISLFLLGGLIAGLMFGYVASNPVWKSLWFTNMEYWSIPTRLYWVTAGVALVLAVATSYVISRYAGWLVASPSLIRHVAAALLVTSAVPAGAVVAQTATTSIGLFELLLIPVTIALLIAIGMWVVTKKWSSRLTAVMILAILLGIAIPNGLFLLIGISDRSFEMIKLACVFSFVSAVCGYWLYSRLQLQS